MKKNSDLLGMVLALLLPQCIQLVVGRAPGPIFLGWALPKVSKLQARKLSSLTGPKLWDIMGFKNERKK
tara:strand:- start:447 stop:653 length:207 start_codon:yes stop_codon:yes gene_type:complete